MSTGSIDANQSSLKMLTTYNVRKHHTTTLGIIHKQHKLSYKFIDKLKRSIKQIVEICLLKITRYTGEGFAMTRAKD